MSYTLSLSSCPWMISFKMLWPLIYWWINCIFVSSINLDFKVDSYNCLCQLHRLFLQAALLVVWPLSYTVMIFGIFFPNMQMWSVLQMQGFSLMSMCFTFCFCRSLLNLSLSSITYIRLLLFVWLSCPISQYIYWILKNSFWFYSLFCGHK